MATKEEDRHVHPSSQSNGITLRQHFAGLAMQGLLANTRTAENIGDHDVDPKVTLIFAVRLADALIKELDRTAMEPK